MHDCQTITKSLRFTHNMRGKDYTLTLIAQFRHRAQQSTRHEYIESTSRFVENNYWGSCTSARAIDTFCFIPFDILAPATSRISRIWRPRRATPFVLAGVEAPCHANIRNIPPFPSGHAIIDGSIHGNKTDLPPNLCWLREYIVSIDGSRTRSRL